MRKYIRSLSIQEVVKCFSNEGNENKTKAELYLMPFDWQKIMSILPMLTDQ